MHFCVSWFSLARYNPFIEGLQSYDTKYNCHWKGSMKKNAKYISSFCQSNSRYDHLLCLLKPISILAWPSFIYSEIFLFDHPLSILKAILFCRPSMFLKMTKDMTFHLYSCTTIKKMLLEMGKEIDIICGFSFIYVSTQISWQ